MKQPRLALLALAAAAVGAATPGGRHMADVVFVGGHVWAGKGLAGGTALALRGDRIVAVGDDASIRALAGPATRVVELRGRSVVPGFNDAHVHFLDGSFGLLSVDLRDARDEADLARRIGGHAAKLPAGEWILQGNWDHEAWPTKALPTRQAIDALTAKNPVSVNRLDGHMLLANSLALKLAGITRDTPDPDGGTIVRDGKGEPTGILKDNAQELVAKVVPETSREQNLRAARAGLAEAARLGVTTIQDNSTIDALPTYLELKSRGELTARFSVWRYASSSMAPLIAAGVRSGLGDDWIRLGALKILSDGSMGAGTAAFFEPYADDPSTKGLLLHPVADLEKMIADADKAGFQLAVHAIGDRANTLVLDAFEKAARANGARARRFRIEHAQVVKTSDLARYKAMGVIASIQPSHCIDDMRWAERRIGEARSHDSYKIGSFVRAGIPVAFGTDWFVEPLDPRLGIYAAVTREFVGGGPAGGWHPEEKIGLEEALDAYTRGSAYAEFTEDAKGTLAPGMLADLVVFGGNIFDGPPSHLLNTPVEMTVVGGRVVYEKK